MLRRVTHQGLHILFVTGDDDAERLDLENAGVGAIESTRQLIKEEFALDEALQIVLNTFAWRCVHGSGSPTLVRGQEYRVQKYCVCRQESE
jgi:hypothetical protein